MLCGILVKFDTIALTKIQHKSYNVPFENIKHLFNICGYELIATQNCKNRNDGIIIFVKDTYCFKYYEIANEHVTGVTVELSVEKATKVNVTAL